MSLQEFEFKVVERDASLEGFRNLVLEYQNIYLNSQGIDQVELSNLYKSQAQTSTRLLELLDSIKEKEELLATYKIQAEASMAQIKSLNCKLEDFSENIKEKEGVIQILQDELSAHQLELVHKEASANKFLEKIKNLEKENQDLVNRLIEIKEKQASTVNEANDVMTTALSKLGFLKRVERKQSQVIQDVSVKFPPCYPPTQVFKKVSWHESDINCISVSKSGDLIATGANDKNVLLLNSNTGSKEAVLTGALQGIMFTDFNSTSELVLGASNDQSIRIWNISSQRLKASLTGHVGKVYSARFIQDSTIISGSHDRTIKIWDLNRGYCVKTIFSLSSCNDLTAANLDGSVIISGHLDNNIRLWDSRSGNQIREIIGVHAAQITGVHMFPDLTKFLTTSRDNTLKIIDMRTYEPLLTLSHEQFKVGLNWSKSSVSPDGKFISSGSQDGSLFVWNSTTGTLEKMLKGHVVPICGAVWSPIGGGVVYSADKEKNVVFWC